MIRMLHLADLHLGWEPPWEAIASERRLERDRRLALAVDWALENRIDVVVIAGDLFETHRPSAGLVREVVSQLARLVQNDVGLVTVPGNHDEISYHDSVYRTAASEWPGVLVQAPHLCRAATIRTRGGDVHVDSLAYTAGITRTAEPLARFPKGDEPGVHIVALHGSLDWNTNDRSLPIDRRAIMGAGYHYAALGHIHRHQTTRGRFPVVYAGMVEGKGFDDPGTGAYTVVTVSESESRIEQVDAKARRVMTLEEDAGAFGSLEALADTLARRLSPDDIVRLRILGSPAYPVDAPWLTSRLGAAGRFACVDDRTDGAPLHALASIAAEPTLRGLFAARMLKRAEEADGREAQIARRALTLGLAALARERSK